jgi:hypothetical protein
VRVVDIKEVEKGLVVFLLLIVVFLVNMLLGGFLGVFGGVMDWGGAPQVRARSYAWDRRCILSSTPRW